MRPWLRKAAVAALVVDLGAGVFFAGKAVAAVGDPSSSTATSSAVTVAWTTDRSSYDPDYLSPDQPDPNDPNQDLFKNLQVTVGQTKDLTDQGLKVSWTGGKPTSSGGAAYNYLQIMQCWASSNAGPSPEQCQWGTPNSALASQVGVNAATRALNDPSQGVGVDPKQDLGPNYSHGQPGRRVGKLVPFWSADDPSRSALTWTNDTTAYPPFSAAQSNEVTYARTAADGTGQYIVNLQSSLSAPYLGCGSTVSQSRGQSCWLVVVPRGAYNLDGSLGIDHATDESYAPNNTYVAGSPLSASAWQNRIQIKLDFTPIGANCTIGSKEVRTAGSEMVSLAFASWQNTLCAKGTVFGYSKIGDSQARTDLVSGLAGSPTMDFVGAPVSSDALNGATIAYAPVTTSALVVSYLIDKNYLTSPADAQANPDFGANGTLVSDLRLTPRLIAKLLTQTYRSDVPGAGSVAGSTVAASNPYTIRADPEFLALNPNFRFFGANAAPDGLIVPFGDSDAAKMLWGFVCANSEAKSFLAGKPDPWGTKVNGSYKDLDLCSGDQASFPKADSTTTRPQTANPPGYGTLDMRPYSADFQDGALRALNANAGVKTTWDDTRVPPQFTSTGSQLPGTRFEMVVTTSEAASLYGLPVAGLVSSSDEVNNPGATPTVAAMQAQLTARVPTEVSGVHEPNPGAWIDGGYPLTDQTYAAINVCAASIEELKAYTTFLGYAAELGQAPGTEPGKLPPGYAPLGAEDRKQTKATVALLNAEITDPKCPSHNPTPSETPSETATPTDTPTDAPTETTDGPSIPMPSEPGIATDPSSCPVTLPDLRTSRRRPRRPRTWMPG